ncbi:MAG TPA: sigma-54-dependent Fis family transcriptional regulator [Acidobacteria bacterium]|nr:sigma-54-dependent Fis family transcriptional regulator [Acidobacteriota bacterium]
MKWRVLVVDDEETLQTTLRDTLEDEGYEVEVAGSVAEARRLIERNLPHMALCDLRLPDGNGMEVLDILKRKEPRLPVLILTAFGSVEGAVEAMKAGADEYLTKPFEEAQLLAVVARHLEVRRLRRRVEELEGASPRPIGMASSFVKVVELAETVARSDTSVLILGETGTGKEVLARYVHERSRRRARPFVAVNCAALPETLLEAELFGHERGAFTGAVRARRGRFEAADGGTLFLDEVAEMSPRVQGKLLRVLQEQTFERLGSNQTVSVDVRIIAATRRNLEADVESGAFRDDLYYRLRVVPITVPPLRERPGDIALLAQLFARRFAEQFDRELELTPETLRCLEAQPFPGNVRELENLIQRLAVICPSGVVTPRDLPEEYRSGGGLVVGADRLRFDGTLAEQASAFERMVLEAALERHGGHRGRMAESLGISRKNLWQKLKAHGLDDT